MPWTNNIDNTTLYSEPVNGGVGFQAWTALKTPGTNSGYFLGSSTQYGGGNLDSPNGTSFGLYGNNSGNNAYAYRKLIEPIMFGGRYSFKMGTQWRDGQKGFFCYSDGTPVLLFQAAGDRYEWTTDFVTYNNTNWMYSGTSVFTILIERKNNISSVDSLFFTVQRDAPADSFTAERTTNLNFNEVGFFNQNTTGTGNNNLYFNFLSCYNAYRL